VEVLSGLNPTKILIKKSDLARVLEEGEKYDEQGVETGWSANGIIHDNRVYEIKRIVDAGPNCRREAAAFTIDPDVVSAALAEDIENNPKTRNLLDGHSHPFPYPPYPSCIDTAQLRRERERRPWFCSAIQSGRNIRFYGLDENGSPARIPYQVIPDDFREENLIARINEITDHEKLGKKRVVIIGCGSLGAAVVHALAGTGIKNYILCDMGRLELVNVTRHNGCVYDLGRNKTEILKGYLESHNPLAYVQTVNYDLVKNRELLRQLVKWSDLVISSSGNPELAYHINILSVQMKKPAVYGGIYDKAESAYVFRYEANRGMACLNCILPLAAAIDNNTIARKYGLADGELKQAQGMFADISIPGSMMAKMAMSIMMEQKKEFNLVRYFSDLAVRRFKVEKKKLCPTCDYEKWLEEETKNLDKPIQKAVHKNVQ